MILCDSHSETGYELIEKDNLRACYTNFTGNVENSKISGTTPWGLAVNQRLTHTFSWPLYWDTVAPLNYQNYGCALLVICSRVVSLITPAHTTGHCQWSEAAILSVAVWVNWLLVNWLVATDNHCTGLHIIQITWKSVFMGKTKKTFFSLGPNGDTKKTVSNSVSSARLNERSTLLFWVDLYLRKLHQTPAAWFRILSVEWTTAVLLWEGPLTLIRTPTSALLQL